MATEIALLHDVSKCTGCRGCMVACKQWKNLPAEITPFTGEYQSHRDLSPTTYSLIKMREDYADGKFKWLFSKFQCMHCGDPACAAACPEMALTKTEAGPVAHDDEKCVGCGYCAINCTFGVPHVNPATKKSVKCDLCADRLERGMIPACAKTCPSNAIIFGPRDELKSEAMERVKVLKAVYPDAMVYGADENDGVKGTAMMYVLTDKPSAFGFPDDPRVSPSIAVWKEYVQPGGKILMGAAAVTVAGAFIANSVLGKKSDRDGGKKDE